TPPPSTTWAAPCYRWRPDDDAVLGRAAIAGVSTEPCTCACHECVAGVRIEQDEGSAEAGRGARWIYGGERAAQLGVADERIFRVELLPPVIARRAAEVADGEEYDPRDGRLSVDPYRGVEHDAPHMRQVVPHILLREGRRAVVARANARAIFL